jgi:hypothetical protein
MDAANLSRTTLAALGREYMLFGHLLLAGDPHPALVIDARAEASPPPEVAMVAGTSTANFMFVAVDPSS